MFTKSTYNHSVYFSLILLLLSSLILTACERGEATTLSPSPQPELPPTVKLTVSTVNIQEGKEAAILVEIQPYHEFVWAWEISGTSEGTLNSYTGENVVYTAGKAGIDTVTARAQLADGTPIKQSVTINVEPAATEIPPATETPLPPKVTLTSPQNEQKVPCENIASGTYPTNLEKNIWPIVYIGGVYYPQDEGGKAAQKVDGQWYQTVRFGDCTRTNVDEGKQFQLIIVTTDESANAAFEAYFQNAQVTGNWGGMPELPEGIEEHVRIVVIRE